MTKQMMNRFTCDAIGCSSDPVYTTQATPDGWIRFEIQERHLWACPGHAEWLLRTYGTDENRARHE